MYEVTEVIGEESYTNKFIVESAKDVHPDLKACFDRLKPIQARIYGMTSFLTLIDSPEFKATKKQNEAARAFSDEILKNIEVRGVSLSGSGDAVGIVLTGLLTSGNNQKTAINTPRLKFNSEVYGFEEDLEEISGQIEKEVYEFLFNGKKAQLELFNGEPDDDDDENDDHQSVDSFPDVDDPADDDDDADDYVDPLEDDEV